MPAPFLRGSEDALRRAVSSQIRRRSSFCAPCEVGGRAPGILLGADRRRLLLSLRAQRRAFLPVSTAVAARDCAVWTAHEGIFGDCRFVSSWIHLLYIRISTIRSIHYFGHRHSVLENGALAKFMEQEIPIFFFFLAK